MEIKLEPGKYILAVSGGVDSSVLLDLLAKLANKTPDYEIIVAHFDHGIRHDSELDAHLVGDLAEKYGLKFETQRRELGKSASEELARDYRYKFLNELKEKYSADGVIMAHHKDDAAETALINLYRGTGRKGLTSIKNPKIIRPLLGFTKQEIIDYAKKNKLVWREDVTNQDEKYLRNRFRKNLLKNHKTKGKVLDIVADLSNLNLELDDLLRNELEENSEYKHKIDRKYFLNLPYKVSCELLHYWLSSNDVSTSKSNIQNLVEQIKTAHPVKSFDLSKGKRIKLTSEHISLELV